MKDNIELYKLGDDVLLEIMSALQNALLEGIDVSEYLRELELCVDKEENVINLKET